MQTQNLNFFVYILGGQPRSDVQIGIAGDLQEQVEYLKAAAGQEPSSPKKLVYYEHYHQKEVALSRERKIKEGGMDTTFKLIESMNPNWLDLSDTLS